MRDKERGTDYSHMVKESNNLIPEQTRWQLDQQAIISLYESCFRDVFQDMETLHQDVQTVKSHLYERQYIEAFDTERKREAYVLRWSPSRSLAYASLMASLDEVRETLLDQDSSRVLCIGGGAGGEVVALASLFAQAEQPPRLGAHQWVVDLVDISDWSSTVTKLTRSIHRELCMQNDANFNVNFKLGDVLRMKKLDIPNMDLITLMFTTNELFKEDKIGSVNFLHKLNSEAKSGALLLIVESAGSYSHIEIGKKTFPVTFLIDMVLSGKGPWEKVSEEDSIWFRCNRQWEYQFSLENTRVFYRLYRHK